MSAAFAQTDDVAELLGQLRDAEPSEAERISAELLERWSHSGSAAMDLLLMRGRTAMEAEDYAAALDHFTALTDHAPAFAEGWASRATTYFLQDRYGEALHDLEQTLALNPHHFNAFFGLGVILERLGYDEEALEALEAGAAIHPHQADINTAIERIKARVEGTAL